MGGTGGMPPMPPQVVSLTLMDADADVPLMALEQNAVLDVSTLPAGLTLRADTNPAVTGSVTFDQDGARIRTEGIAPYSLTSDATGDFYPWTLGLGQHTVVATPYSMGSATGLQGPAFSRTFTLVDGGGGSGGTGGAGTGGAGTGGGGTGGGDAGTGGGDAGTGGGDAGTGGGDAGSGGATAGSGGATAGSGGATTGSGGAATAGSGGIISAGGAPTSGTGGGTAGTSGSNPSTPPGDGTLDGSCGCRVPGDSAPRGGHTWLIGVAALAGLLSRRRRARA